MQLVTKTSRTASCFLFRISLILLMPSWHWVLSLLELSLPNMLMVVFADIRELSANDGPNLYTVAGLRRHTKTRFVLDQN